MANDFTIGVVGVGRMGSNIARHLKYDGFTVSVVYDSASSLAGDLAAELGCAHAETLADVTAKANTIITVVTNDDSMREIFGESGDSLEGCMASSITQAREGTLYLMCGGKQDVFDNVKPILDSMSTDLRYIGESGKAAQVKALVNMVMNINTAGLAEGLGLGQSLGLDLNVLMEVFSQTGANSRVLETDGEDMVARDHECYFSSAHAAKDSGIALDLAEEEGLNLPLAKATKAQFDKMIEVGKGELDKSGVAELTFPGRS